MSDDVSNAIAAIKSGQHAYVAQGSSTGLGVSLNSGDQVVLVILPASAGDPAAIAQQIDAATGGEKIIGLVVGDQAVGYAARFPAGVASDIMDRANSLTNTPRDALPIFVSKVHEYQASAEGQSAMRPKTTTGQTQPKAPPGDSGTPLVGVLGALVLIPVICVAVAIQVIRTRARKRHTADPSSLSSIPTFDPKRKYTSRDLLDNLARIPSQPDLPPTAKASLASARSDLDDMLTNAWDEVQANQGVAYEIVQIVMDYIPTTLRLYGRLPVDLRDAPLRLGQAAPRVAAIEQMEMIDHRVGEIRKAAYAGAIKQLEVQSGFLREKYRESSFNFDSTPNPV